MKILHTIFFFLGVPVRVVLMYAPKTLSLIFFMIYILYLMII